MAISADATFSWIRICCTWFEDSWGSEWVGCDRTEWQSGRVACCQVGSVQLRERNWNNQISSQFQLLRWLQISISWLHLLFPQTTHTFSSTPKRWLNLFPFHVMNLSITSSLIPKIIKKLYHSFPFTRSPKLSPTLLIPHGQETTTFNDLFLEPHVGKNLSPLPLSTQLLNLFATFFSDSHRHQNFCLLFS